MKKNLFFLLVILTLTIGVFILTKSMRSKADIAGFEVREEDSAMVLYKIFSDQSSERAGLKVSLSEAGTYEVPINIVISPNKELALFNEWHEVSMEIYVANIDGARKRKIAEQEVPEGSGELLPETLQWSADGKYITYQESGMRGDGIGVLPSGEFTARKIITTYRVNITDTTKEKISEVGGD